jgi:uncharacterized protein YodC (DUF2158 family)
MATVFKKGDAVKVNTVVPQGPVLALRMDEDGVVYYRIEWTDINGTVQQRWFTEDSLIAAGE